MTKIRKVTDIEHVRLRISRYLGSNIPTTNESYLVKDDKFVKGDITWIPAFLKIFSEILENSVDYSKIPDGKHLNEIRITLCKLTGEISVWDNGGIVIKYMNEYKQYTPEVIFGSLRSGSNFDDDEDFKTGSNGEGASLTNILSTNFMVNTADGKQSFKQIFEDGMKVVGKPIIKKSRLRFTKITFNPDYEFFKTNINEQYDKLVKRVYDIAGCNPHLKIVLNGEKINFDSFKDYVSVYTNDFLYIDDVHFRVAVNESDDGFKHISFVNSSETWVGGTHVDYVANQIITALRTFIKKKHKVDVKPSVIKNHLMLFIDCDIVNPRYTSQTKENLITDVKEYKTTFTISDKDVKKLVSSNIIERIMNYVQNQERLQEIADAKKLNKTTNKSTLKHILKFDDANQKTLRNECTIFFTEGDSASKPLTSARDPKTMGVFSLKGKVVNVMKTPLKKLMKNDEFVNIMAVLGLKLGEQPTRSSLRFGKIVITTDADHDGSHICGLMLNLFNHFWSDLLKNGHVYRLKTPIVKATYRKKEYEFFTLPEFETWSKGKSSVVSKYFKGLGSHSSKDFKRYMNDSNYYEQLSLDDIDDSESLDLVFNQNRANDRKEWLIK